MEPLLDLKIKNRFNRRVLFGHVDRLGAWPEIAPAPGDRFALLLINGDQAHSVHELSALADDLIDRGCVWFSSWGPGCELAHDVFDESVVGRGIHDEGFDADRMPEIETTWHTKDSLEDVIWFFLECVRPFPPHESIESTVVLVCGDLALCESALVAIAKTAL